MITPSGHFGHVLRWPDEPMRRGVHPPECPVCKCVTPIELAELMEVIVLEPRHIYDRALRGVSNAGGEFHAVYDIEECMQALVDTQGWDEEEAWEWLHYNTIRGCSIGPEYPSFA